MGMLIVRVTLNRDCGQNIGRECGKWSPERETSGDRSCHWWKVKMAQTTEEEQGTYIYP